MAEIQFADYHQGTLPDLLQGGRGELLKGLTLPTLGLSVEEEAVTYRLADGALSLEPGNEGADVVVELSAEDWRGLVEDLESVPGILYGDRLLGHRGNLMHFVRWEPVLRTLYTGRPLYDTEGFTLLDGEGNTLDPLTSFTVESDSETMGRFLDAAGYLLVREVFSSEEVEVFRAAAAEVAAAASEGDQHSWWGKSDGGEAVLCRCLNAGEWPAFNGLYEDPRIARLAALLPEGTLHPRAEEQDGVTVIFKRPGVAEGLADLPWHRDCGMGGHARMCPTFVLSIYLEDATEAQGPLKFLPGSHRYSLGFADAAEVDFAAAVTVPARAGDITLHIGDVMHAAPPPAPGQSRYRQSVLLSYHPDFENHRGERHYNDALLGDEQGQVKHLKGMV